MTDEACLEKNLLYLFYSLHFLLDISTMEESQSDEHEASQEEEPWEKEVEDLVVWSNSLDQARWN